MPDMEKVIGHLNDCMEASRRDNTWVFVRKDIIVDTIALLKEQHERLNSIVCFENGDQVRIWHCPLCKSEVRLVMKNWNVIEDHLLGIKKVVERPQDIRVVTDDERVIVLKKEIPTMVMNRRDWSDNDA